MLESQIYKNFKLFIVGDNYLPAKEFDEVCKLYKKDIYYYNNPLSFRELKLDLPRNYWAIGGVLAAKIAYQKAKEEGYGILFMLDDDDFWYDNHIEIVMNNLIKYPQSAFILTRADQGQWRPTRPPTWQRRGPFPQPRTNIREIYYNNYMTEGGDSVRAASIHNLYFMYNIQMDLWNQVIEQANKTHESILPAPRMAPVDGRLLQIVREKVIDGVFRMLYIPIITVLKQYGSQPANMIGGWRDVCSITSDVDSLRDAAEVADVAHRLVGRVLVLGLERAVIHRLVDQVLVLGLECAAIHALTACLLAARSSVAVAAAGK